MQVIVKINKVIDKVNQQEEQIKALQKQVIFLSLKNSEEE